MLNIVICEDEEIIRKKIEHNLGNISLRHDLDLHIPLSTHNPNEVYNYAQNNKFDILILDIDLKDPNLDGIKLGNKLRLIDKDLVIVFLSSRLERIFESFSCTPFNFIPKPSINPHLEETILRIVEYRFNCPHDNFVKIKNCIINLSEISYIEKQLTKAYFYSKNNCIEVYISFVELLSCLPENFVQISKSYIVNKCFISNINKVSRTITLKNNLQLKYSNKYEERMGGILNV